MAKKKKKEEETSKKPKVHEDLEGLEIKVNALGEVVTNYDIDKINEFLNKNVEDKKFKGTSMENKEEDDSDEE